MCLKPIPPASADHPKEIVRELFKCEHIFRSLGFKFEFSLSPASNLPVLTDSALGFPAKCKYLCFYSAPPTPKKLKPIRKEFAPLAPRIPVRWTRPTSVTELGEGTQLIAAESMAHALRLRAMLESDPEKRRRLCAEASEIYEFVLIVCGHKGVLNILRDQARMVKRCDQVTMFEGIEDLDPLHRRFMSHSLAGMAVCALVGQQSPNLFFGLAAAAVACTDDQPLALGALLRVWLLQVGAHHLNIEVLHGGKLVFKPTIHYGAATTMSMPVVDPGLMRGGGVVLTPTVHYGETLMDMPVVYHWMTRGVVLPLVLRFGTPQMLQGERSLVVPADEWDEAHTAALAFNQRALDRQSGAIPSPKKVTRLHSIKGLVVERVCAHCGEWERDTPFMRCARCLSVYYCGRECQVAGWRAGHRDVCPAK